MTAKPLDAWEILFRRALEIIDSVSASGTRFDDWSFGGGTVLMRRYHHRLSKDVDIFAPDPQYLGYVSPRLNDTADSLASDYLETANSAKLFFPEGEIDFIAGAPLTEKPTVDETILGRKVRVETTAEILAKKPGNPLRSRSSGRFCASAGRSSGRESQEGQRRCARCFPKSIRSSFSRNSMRASESWKVSSMRVELKRIALTLSLMLATAPACADWVRVGKTNMAVHYVDPATVRSVGNFRQVWAMQDMVDWDFNGVRSMRLLQEYDCAAARFRFVEIAAHAGAMGGGQVLAEYAMRDRWTVLRPTAIGRMVCGS